MNDIPRDLSSCTVTNAQSAVILQLDPSVNQAETIYLAAKICPYFT